MEQTQEAALALIAETPKPDVHLAETIKQLAEANELQPRVIAGIEAYIKAEYRAANDARTAKESAKTSSDRWAEVRDMAGRTDDLVDKMQDAEEQPAKPLEGACFLCTRRLDAFAFSVDADGIEICPPCADELTLPSKAELALQLVAVLQAWMERGEESHWYVNEVLAKCPKKQQKFFRKKLSESREIYPPEKALRTALDALRTQYPKAFETANVQDAVKAAESAPAADERELIDVGEEALDSRFVPAALPGEIANKVIEANSGALIEEEHAEGDFTVRAVARELNGKWRAEVEYHTTGPNGDDCQLKLKWHDTPDAALSAALSEALPHFRRLVTDPKAKNEEKAAAIAMRDWIKAAIQVKAEQAAAEMEPARLIKHKIGKQSIEVQIRKAGDVWEKTESLQSGAYAGYGSPWSGEYADADEAARASLEYATKFFGGIAANGSTPKATVAEAEKMLAWLRDESAKLSELVGSAASE